MPHRQSPKPPAKPINDLIIRICIAIFSVGITCLIARLLFFLGYLP
jgi:hypothetical protein